MTDPRSAWYVLLIGEPSGADTWRNHLRWHVRRNIEYGEWLEREATKRELPTIAARPRDTLVDRILRAGLA